MAANGGGKTDWEFDSFDDGSLKIVGEVQLRKYRTFLEEYATHLVDIEDALDDSLGEAWDFHLDPVVVEPAARETASALELIRTDNKVFNKVIVALLTLCEEMDSLTHEAETTFYPPLVMYGEGTKDQGEGDAQVQMGKMLPLLQRLATFADRCGRVVKNVIQQLAMLYSPNPTSQAIDAREVHLESIFQHLGAVLRVLITLDELIAANPTILENWTLYKRMIKSVRANSGMFSVTQEQLRPFEKFLKFMEGHLLEGMLFQNCIEKQFDDMSVSVTTNPVLRDEFATNLKIMIQQLEPRVGEPNDREHRTQFVGLIGLFVFFEQLFGVLDKRMVKALWDMQRKIPAVFLYGTAILCPNEFLSRKLPQLGRLIDKKSADYLGVQRESLQRMDGSIAGDAQGLYMAVSTWLVKMENTMRIGNLQELLNAQCQLLTEGVILAHRLSHYVRTFMTLHLSLGVAMTRSHVRAVFRMVELLQAIQQSFFRRSMFVATSVQHIIQHMSFLCITETQQAFKQMAADKTKYTARTLDVLAALSLLQTALNGPQTPKRRLTAKIALSVANQARVFAPGQVEKISSLLTRIEIISSLRLSVSRACNVEFLYWHRELFGLHLQDIYDEPADAHRLQYLFAALQDCLPSLREAEKTLPQPIVESFKKDIDDMFEKHILLPLCRDIETDLRLQVHTGVVQLDDRNPFKTSTKDLTHFLRVKPLRFVEGCHDIKLYVTHYLDTTFYNLTTVALHDWKSYGQMQHLAMQKYGLSMQESHLPSQTLEQGLDVLEIMRNIHVFVAKYLYNLNNQIFVERNSKNKFLNTINIRHVANSIRTHGTGIMNTTVNFTYQFLCKKFFTFSQFLYDDHIKSRLIKDVRYFREVKDKTDQRYPFERAEKFTKIIRKLGINDQGQSYLDQFRNLITEIGNAMGYIRMIRSGGLHCCSNAIRFVPDLDDIVSFEEMVGEENLAPETKRAASNLDAIIQSLIKNFAEGTEYFKMLVDIFATEFRSKKNTHLRNFHIIVPPLTINFVEHIISAKEKISKKNKSGAAFTDDGFAMGVAYILKLLDLYESFDSLHWFQACKAHYAREKAKVKAQTDSAKADEKLIQTVSLSLKRIALYEKEMDLLFYSLSSARIFFRADQTAAEEKAAEEEKKAAEAAQAGEEAPAADAAAAPAAPAAAAAAPATGAGAGAPPPPPPPDAADVPQAPVAAVKASVPPPAAAGAPPPPPPPGPPPDLLAPPSPAPPRSSAGPQAPPPGPLAKASSDDKLSKALAASNTDTAMGSPLAGLASLLRQRNAACHDDDSANGSPRGSKRHPPTKSPKPLRAQPNGVAPPPPGSPAPPPPAAQRGKPKMFARTSPGGAPPPPPPSAAPTNTARPASTPGRSGLLGDIRKGKRLKHVSAPPN
eukprot:m.280544 g.280544  ORF g.280544 m.280544 type:complete len:1394 (+) comp19399_c4_seq16:109-4290(+)